MADGPSPVRVVASACRKGWSRLEVPGHRPVHVAPLPLTAGETLLLEKRFISTLKVASILLSRNRVRRLRATYIERVVKWMEEEAGCRCTAVHFRLYPATTMVRTQRTTVPTLVLGHSRKIRFGDGVIDPADLPDPTRPFGFYTLDKDLRYTICADEDYPYSHTLFIRLETTATLPRRRKSKTRPCGTQDTAE